MVIVLFFQGEIVKVDEKLEEKLKAAEDSSEESSDEVEDNLEDDEELMNRLNNELKLNEANLPFGNLKRLNLDVSTLLSLVSDLTNNKDEQIVFDKDYLNQQVQAEKERPILPILENFMKGKKYFKNNQ